MTEPGRHPRVSARHVDAERRRNRVTAVFVTVAAVGVLCFVLARWVVPAGAAFPIGFS